MQRNAAENCGLTVLAVLLTVLAVLLTVPTFTE
jgi:hypothetical protein